MMYMYTIYMCVVVHLLVCVFINKYLLEHTFKCVFACVDMAVSLYLSE